MHESNLLEIMAAGFALALLFGYAAKRLHLSPIVGYLLAGFLVGPHTPGFVADTDLAMQLSEAGVILLMFGVGLHFNMDDLMAVKGVALPGAIIQASVATLCGTWAGVSFGLPLTAAVMLGLGLSVASTVVLLRVLEDAHMVDTVQGHVAIGWLVVEDLLTVLVLVLLPSLAGILVVSGPEGAEAVANPDAWDMATALGVALFRLIALWVLVLVVGGRVVPWLLTKVARTRSQELFTLTILVAAFATAVGAAVFFHASMALGAFLGGMVVGKTELSHKAGADLLPLRDAFAVLFFIAVGMLFNPVYFLESPGLILACLAVVLIVKPLTAMLAVSALGYSARTGLTVGISLSQVGEFSFILAQQAQDLKLIPVDVYNILVICALISITLNPGAFRQLPRLEKAFSSVGWLWHLLNARADARTRKAQSGPEPAFVPAAEVPSAIVVGYGPTGRSVCAALRDSDLRPVVIDMNVDTVNYLASEGRGAVFGDSSREEILHAAGVDSARYLVITIPDMEVTAATAVAAKCMNPDIRILVRARFLEDEKLLLNTGISGIAFEEEEVARSLTDLVLQDMAQCAEGACPVYEHQL